MFAMTERESTGSARLSQRTRAGQSQMGSTQGAGGSKQCPGCRRLRSTNRAPAIKEKEHHLKTHNQPSS